jgi:hypothetical protein
MELFQIAMDAMRIWNNDPYTSFGKRHGVGVMGLFPIESQL